MGYVVESHQYHIVGHSKLHQYSNSITLYIHAYRTTLSSLFSLQVGQVLTFTRLVSRGQALSPLPLLCNAPGGAAQ